MAINMNSNSGVDWKSLMNQESENVFSAEPVNTSYEMSNTNNNMFAKYENNVNTHSTVSQDQMMSEISEYKQYLRSLPEVQNLTSEIEVQNPNSIVMFGQQASKCISQISDELLANMRAIQPEEANEMLVALTKLMDKFDVEEIKEAGNKRTALDKLFKNIGTTLAKIFQKYDTMGMEVEKIYNLLKKYECQIKESNIHLKKLYEGNMYFFQMLEKYIVAGEMAIEELDMYIEQVTLDPNIAENERNMMLEKLAICKEMLEQRVYDLAIAENVALQSAPMIQVMEVSNFNLMRKINSAFIVTLPIFKQCLAQAILLKRQEIQAKSLKQLDDKTNELLQRNATSLAKTSVNIAKMAGGSSIKIDTLEKTYATIMSGIEEMKAVQQQNAMERKENMRKLEQLKYNLTHKH